MDAGGAWPLTAGIPVICAVTALPRVLGPVRPSDENRAKAQRQKEPKRFEKTMAVRSEGSTVRAPRCGGTSRPDDERACKAIRPRLDKGSSGGHRRARPKTMAAPARGRSARQDAAERASRGCDNSTLATAARHGNPAARPWTNAHAPRQLSGTAIIRAEGRSSAQKTVLPAEARRSS